MHYAFILYKYYFHNNYNVEKNYVQRDPNAKFVELANKHGNKSIKDIRQVGNLSNKTVYSNDDAQAKKIIKVLQELDIMKARFKGSDSDDEDVFKL